MTRLVPLLVRNAVHNPKETIIEVLTKVFDAQVFHEDTAKPSFGPSQSRVFFFIAITLTNVKT